MRATPFRSAWTPSDEALSAIVEQAVARVRARIAAARQQSPEKEPG
jgi:hypothetical protein